VYVVLSALSDAQDFYSIPVELLDEESKHLYDHCRKFYNEHGKFPAFNTLRESYKTKDKKDLVFTDPEEKFTYYFRQLTKQSILAEAGGLLSSISSAYASNDSEAFADELEKANKRVLSIAAAGVDPKIYTAGSANYLLDAEKEAASPAAVSTGIDVVDKATSGGFRRSEIYTIAGAEKSGKTSVLTFMATKARESGKKVLFLSCERDKSSVNRLVMSILSNIPPEVLERVSPPLTPEQRRRVEASDKILKPEEEGFTILHPMEQATPSMLIPYIIKLKPDILFIDSVYMMAHETKTSSSKHINQTEEVKLLITQLKIIALTYNIPIVVSTQLNRTLVLSDAGKWADNIYGSAVYAQYCAFCLCLTRDKAAELKIVASLEKLRYSSGEPLLPFTLWHTSLESKQDMNFTFAGAYDIPQKNKAASVFRA
jgi:replicative DNA helicase